MVGVRSIDGRKVGAIPDTQVRLLNYLARLDRIHAMYDLAASEIMRATGQPICIDGCGACCHNSVLSYGIEAEHAASWLLGQPGHVKRRILDRIREWLTKPGEYTYGNRLTPQMVSDQWQEFQRVAREECCFLGEDKTCLIHWARPLVCRAFGVTRMPHKACPRPLGLGEDENSRAWFNGHHPSIPIYAEVQQLLKCMTEQRYRREGFFATMIFERLAAKELAGLMDDGKIPMLKVAVGIGDSPVGMLWQEQLEDTWSALAADRSIAEQVNLVERDGDLVMKVEVK